MNCEYCGSPWLLDAPLKYHGEADLPNRWHCFACSDKCDRCQNVGTFPQVPTFCVGIHSRSDKEIVVELTQKEAELCERVGRERQRRAENVRGKPDYGIGEQDFSNCHVLGAKGEGAVQKLFGMKVNPNLYPSGDGDIGDVELPNGKTVAVKTRQVNYGGTTYFGYRKESPEGRDLRDDYGILCCADLNFLTPDYWKERKIRILGCFTKEYWIRESRDHTFPNGDKARVLPAMKMFPIRDLLDRIFALPV